MHPLEQEYIRDADSTYINYIAPDYTEYSFYENFINILDNTIIKYEKNPELLKMVGESDLNSIIMQYALNHPMSYHAGEDLNPHASDFGVILTCLPGLYAQENLNTPKFIVTDNEASYLALLFSDHTILKKMLFGINAQWLRNRSTSHYLSEQWLDVIEIQALYSAQISEFEFDMYQATIIKILDRGSQVEIKPNASIQHAINIVVGRLSDAKLIIHSPKLIKNKIEILYSKYSAQIFAVALQMDNYANIDDDRSTEDLHTYNGKSFSLD